MQVEEGKLWSAIRSELSFQREAITAAYDQKSYEAESLMLDGIARAVVDRIKERLEKGRT